MEQAPPRGELTGDVWGGLASALVALPASIAFGVASYAGLGPDAAAQGALAGLIGAAVLGVVAALLGATQALVTAPCAPAAAVLGALAAELFQGGAAAPSQVIVLLTLVALLSAALQFIFGLVGGGTLIKFIPYPVVTGYLSGVGVVIFLKQLPVVLGVPKDHLTHSLLHPGTWDHPGLAVALVTIVSMALATRFIKLIPAAICGLAAGIGAYFVLSIFLPELRTLEGNARVVGPIGGAGVSLLDSLNARWDGLRVLSLHDLGRLFVPAATLAVLLSIDTLKTCVIVDALTHTRHGSNRELIAQGLANAASAIVGGVPGAGTSGATLVNIASGGRTRRSGVVEGVLVLVGYLVLSGPVAWTPKPALAGILVVVAWRMFDRKAFKLLKHASTRLDFAVSAAVIVVAVGVGLIQASGTGIALAILLYVRDQVRTTVIRRKVYGNQIYSKQRRLPDQLAALTRVGAQTAVCELQGPLFFGTTDQLLSQLDADLGKCRYMILDLRRVLNVDYTAAHLLDQIEARLAGRGGRLLLSGTGKGGAAGRDLSAYFDEVGLRQADGRVLVFEQLTDALEWTEDRLLEFEGLNLRDEDPPLDMEHLELFRGAAGPELAALQSCVATRVLAPGESVFRQGDTGDEVYLVRRGLVRLELQTAGGQSLHLLTVARGDCFGDMAFLDRGRRSATAVAHTASDIFVLSRARFDEVSAAHPALGRQVMDNFARMLAGRLRHTDAELNALLDA